MKYYGKAILIVIGALSAICMLAVFGPLIISLLGVTVEIAVVFLPLTIAIVAVFILAWWLKKRDGGM